MTQIISDSELEKMVIESGSVIATSTDGKLKYHQLKPEGLRKFAQLVAEECIQACKQLTDDMPSGTSYQDFPDDYDCIAAIRDHFGIKGE